MTELLSILKEQLAIRPRMTVRDAVKLIYQNEFGGGHLVTDIGACTARLSDEMSLCAPLIEPLFEPIGGGLCRINLAAARGRISPETLASAFMLAANTVRGSIESFEKKLRLLTSLPFDPREVSEYLSSYKAEGYPPVSHSEVYRAAYAPAYRIVSERFCRFFDVFSAIDRHMSRAKKTILAIDGRCASGKTTLASLIGEIYGCTVFHMDDYFLPFDMRTEKRLNEPGGNVHRERILDEILLPLSEGRPVIHRRFDCSTGTFGEPVTAPTSALTVIEGSYSLHPELREYYDLKIFLTTDSSEQLDRLEKRDGSEYLKMFTSRWIPLEEKYFSACSAEKAADMVIKT